MAKSEADRVRSALSFLGAEPVEGFSSYAEQAAFEKDRGMFYIGRIGGVRYAVPASVTKEHVNRAADLLRDDRIDTAAIRVALYELWLTTKHTRMSEDDVDAMLTIFVRRLSAYPEDVVTLVLGELSRNARFFPTWVEVQSDLEKHTTVRTALLAALRHLLKRITRTKP